MRWKARRLRKSTDRRSFTREMRGVDEMIEKNVRLVGLLAITFFGIGVR